MCTCGICGQPFPSHTALSDHIFRDHGNSRMPGNNGHKGVIAVIVALLLAVSMLMPAKAQDVQPQPTPSVGEPPRIAVEHKVFMPYISTTETVHGCDDCQAVSWR